jgi:hypothetical protein
MFLQQSPEVTAGERSSCNSRVGGHLQPSINEAASFRFQISPGHGRANIRKGMDVSFHSIRHTSVSLLKDAEVPDAVVMAIAGHSSSAMNHRYTHVGERVARSSCGDVARIITEIKGRRESPSGPCCPSTPPRGKEPMHALPPYSRADFLLGHLSVAPVWTDDTTFRPR